jgi:hypothetical protein
MPTEPSIIVDFKVVDPIIFKEPPSIFPDTLKSPPTNEFEVTVEVPTTSNVSVGFVFPIPSFPEAVREASTVSVE